MASQDRVNEYGLTEREEMFCQYYVYGEKPFNNRYAYSLANPEVTIDSASVMAARLFKKVSVLKRIDQLRQEKIEQLQLDSKYFTLQFLDIYEKCREESPVIKLNRKTGKFEPTGTYEFDSRGAIEAQRSAAKLNGFLLDNKTINANVTVPSIVINPVYEDE